MLCWPPSWSATWRSPSFTSPSLLLSFTGEAHPACHYGTSRQHGMQKQLLARIVSEQEPSALLTGDCALPDHDQILKSTQS